MVVRASSSGKETFTGGQRGPGRRGVWAPFDARQTRSRRARDSSGNYAYELTPWGEVFDLPSTLARKREVKRKQLIESQSEAHRWKKYWDI